MKWTLKFLLCVVVLLAFFLLEPTFYKGPDRIVVGADGLRPGYFIGLSTTIPSPEVDIIYFGKKGEGDSLVALCGIRVLGKYVQPFELKPGEELCKEIFLTEKGKKVCFWLDQDANLHFNKMGW